jgi:hypothetical protein
MTGFPTSTVDAQRLYKNLRSLLYERFRHAFLRRTGREEPTDTTSAAVETIASALLLKRPETRRKVQKIIDRHVGEDARTGSSSYRVYAPEMVKRMALSIGREAWKRRHDGPIRIELKVKSSTVSLHKIRPPNGPIHPLT